MLSSFLCNGIRWLLVLYLHQQFTVLITIFVCWTQLFEYLHIILVIFFPKIVHIKHFCWHYFWNDLINERNANSIWGFEHCLLKFDRCSSPLSHHGWTWMSLLLFEFKDNLTDSSLWNTGETGDMYYKKWNTKCFSERWFNWTSIELRGKKIFVWVFFTLYWIY